MNIDIKRRLKKAGKIIIIIFISYTLISAIFVGIIINVIFGRNELDKYSIDLSYDDIDTQLYPRSEFKFDSNGNLLQGYLYGKGNSKGLILIAHGIISGADSHLPEIMYFVDNGWCVVSFDGTGSRKSEGRGIMGLPQTKLDVIAAIDYIKQDSQLKYLPLCLFGHSMGGYAVTASLETTKAIVAVVCLSGFNSPMDVMYDFSRKKTGFLAVLEYPFLYLYEYICFGKNAYNKAVNAINSSTTPVLYIFGTEDDVVDPYTVGLFAYRGEIANPNFSYFMVNEPYRNWHDNMLRSGEAGLYTSQMRDELEKLHNEYRATIPVDVFSEFLQSVDKNRMNRLDTDIMNSISAFYANAIASIQ
jgi:pimeloyl-ACP methyl ester carboxylesterase